MLGITVQSGETGGAGRGQHGHLAECRSPGDAAQSRGSQRMTRLISVRDHAGPEEYLGIVSPAGVPWRWGREYRALGRTRLSCTCLFPE